MSNRRRARSAGERAALVEAICARLAQGEALAAVLREPGMPPNPTFYTWLKADPALRGLYDRACGRRGRARSAAGRPSRYSAELAARLCAGPEAGDQWLPSEATLRNWLAAHPEFAEDYGRAREAKAHRLFDLALSIAAGATEQTARSDRLRIDTIRWQVAKLAPALYGARRETGPPEPAPMTVVVRRFVYGDEE